MEDKNPQHVKNKLPYFFVFFRKSTVYYFTTTVDE